MGPRRTAPIALLVAAVAALLAASGAQASFHLMQVREVYAGSSAAPEAKYVELQMYASGETFVAGHTLRIYDAAGTAVSTTTFAANVTNGANQSTILVATPQAEAQFGVAADAPLASPAGFGPSGGAACWEALDCVSWGNFTGTLPSPAGNPASPGGIPDGMALQRTISRGCSTLLNTADDSNDSGADFSVVAPQPRPNSVPPSERPCAAEGGPGGGPGPSGAPQTMLRRKPPKRTTDRTPSFRFAASDDSVSFQCRLDRKRFRRCRSPFTSPRLSFGPHRFQVRAVDSEGHADPTPVSYRFRVVRPG